ncbi:MAG: putative immunity/bacteriocin fusion bifunctional protein [Thermacetogeniaceae bacterium]
MKKILRKRWRQVLTVMLTIVMLGTPAMTGYAAANMSGLVSDKVVLSAEKLDQNCESCTSNPKAVEYAKQNFGLSAEVITGEKEHNYLSLFKSFEGFSNLKEKLSVVRVVKVNPINYVYISGAFKEKNDTLLYAVVNGNNNEILMLNTVKYDGSDSVFVKEFSNEGTIKESSISLAEIAQANEENDQELAAFMEKYDSKITLAAINWEYWCCRYAGALACTMGCCVFWELPPVMYACRFMCGYLWKSGVCSKF